DTVVSCYRHLKSLGFIESHGAGGTYVASVPTAEASSADYRALRTYDISTYAEGLVPPTRSLNPSSDPINFTAVPRQLLPVKRWRMAQQNFAETLSMRYLQYDQQVMGRPELRAAVAAYLNRSKGIICTDKEVAVFSSSFAALVIILRLFMEPGEIIAV